MSLFEDFFFRNQEYDIIKNGKSIKTIKRKIYSLIHDFKFQEKAKNPERERERKRETTYQVVITQYKSVILSNIPEAKKVQFSFV